MKKRHSKGWPYGWREPPPEAVAERNRAYSIVPTLGQKWLGEPPQGRSALAQRESEQEKT